MPEPNATLADVFLAATRWLESSGLRYAVVGGLTCGVWGQARATKDVEVLVDASGKHLTFALSSAPQFGFRFDKKKTIAQIRRQGMGRLFCAQFHFDVVCGTSEVEQEAIDRAKRIDMFGRRVPVITAEHAILFKLLAARPQDLVDVEWMAISQKGKLDLPHMRKVARRIASDLMRPDVVRRLEDLLQGRSHGDEK